MTVSPDTRTCMGASRGSAAIPAGRGAGVRPAPVPRTHVRAGRTADADALRLEPRYARSAEDRRRAG